MASTETPLSLGQFTPLSFKSVRGGDLHPPITGYDGTRGYDWVVGELKALHCAQNAIVFTVQFLPGPDAKADDPNCFGEADFLVLRHKNRLVGKILRQAPDNAWDASYGDELKVLDGLGTGPGIGIRQAARFSCMARGYTPGEFSVSAYFRTGLFGGWRDVVIETPKHSLHYAEL